MKTINKRIAEWLDFANLTQSEFAKSISVTKGSVNQWMLGYTRPTPNHEKSIALAFPDLNVYWLWGKDESMTRQNILRPIEKSHIDGIVKENHHLKEMLETKDSLIEVLKSQIEMFKSSQASRQQG